MNFNLSLQADATTTPMLNAEARLEAIAVDIEMTQSVAVFRIGQRLAEARDLFKYDRTVGGFEGWVKSRLGWDNRLARRIISVHENLAEKSGEFAHLSREALFQLAAPSEAPEVREALQKAVADRVANGEAVTAADIKELKAKIADRDERLKTLRSQKAAVDGHNNQLIEDLRSVSADKRRLDERLMELQEELRRATEPGTLTIQPYQNDGSPIDVNADVNIPGYSAWKEALLSLWNAAPTKAREWFTNEVLGNG